MTIESQTGFTSKAIATFGNGLHADTIVLCDENGNPIATGVSRNGAATQTAVVNNILTDPSGAAATDVSCFRSATVQIASTGTGGTFLFEESNDGTNWSPVPVYNAGQILGAPIVGAITATASAILYTFPLRCTFLRLRIATTITGGSIRAFSRFSAEPWVPSVTPVAPAANVFWSESAAAQAASATVTGTSRDTGVAVGTPHRFSAFNAFAFADQAGTLRVECSNDGTTWRRASADTAVGASAAVYLSVPVMARFYRAVFVNGATLQTAFMFNTSFTAA